MTIRVSTNGKNKTTSANEQADSKLLGAYLAGAVSLTAGKTKAEAEKLIKGYHQQTDMQAFKSSPKALDMVQDQEKSLKDQASSYGLKTKLNYASDADVAGVSDVVSFGMAAVATSMLAPIAAADPQVLSATVLTAAAAYTVVKGAKNAAAAVSESKTPEQKKQAAEYASVKHAQLALKLLKKEIEAPLKAAEKAKYKEDVAKLFAAGYGQPGGGMVQMPLTAEAGVPGAAAPKAEPVKEGKKSFWKEAMETYARFGNPGGGMVHNDMPVKDEKSAEASKAEKSHKEGKKSFWKEAMETYARFGNPGGGMVHNDMPVKDEKPAEAAKAEEPAKEEKKSYWSEAMETYARFGNPGGGMVHNDMPAKDEKPAETAKAEKPAKEEKKSYWSEAMETYARFGNPGGGMVHNDMPAKDEKPAETAKAEKPAKEEKKSSYMEEVGKLYAQFGNPGGGMVHNDKPAAKTETNKAVAAAVARRTKGR